MVDTGSIHTNAPIPFVKNVPYQIQLHLLLPMLSSAIYVWMDLISSLFFTFCTWYYMTTLIVQFSLKSYDILLYWFYHQIVTRKPISLQHFSRYWTTHREYIFRILYFCVSNEIMSVGVVIHDIPQCESYFNMMTVCKGDNWREVVRLAWFCFFRYWNWQIFQWIAGKSSFGIVDVWQ